MSRTTDPTKYDLVISPKGGYQNKREITNQAPDVLVAGSQNVIINDGDKVASRLGYILYGQAKTVNQGISSNYDFISKNGKILLRANQGATANTGVLSVKTEYVSGTPVWSDLLTGLTYTDFSWTTWWNATESIRELIFVDGTTSIRKWGGGIAYVESATATTITKSGTETWAEAGFYVSLSGRTVSINGTTYPYTGGEATTTLTGLVGLPALTAGQPVFQGIVTITSLTGVSPAISPDVVMTKDNHVMYGQTDTSVIWGSKTTDYADCGFTSPLRIPSEGFKITIDNNTVGFTQDSDAIYIFAGLDDLYQIKFILASDGSSESITVQKLRAGAGQASISQKAIIPVKNGIMYFTNEKTLTWLTQVQNIFTPQSLPISDPIKNDFDSFDLTGATGVFFENEIWLAIPMENLVYRYDFDKALWQSPQTLTLAGFSIIKDEETQRNILIGHSNNGNESYQLNTGLTDNGVDIEAIACFSYRQFGDRGKLKQFDEYFNEVYMRTDTILTCTHRYEYLGAEAIIEKTINGSDTSILFSPLSDANLGKNNLGKNPLGSTVDETSDLNKYRAIHEMQPIDFFEHQIIYTSSQQYEILAHGPCIRQSTNMPRSIKQ